ncbi:GNAT family N-acetyltransferase [Propioniciclava soli]|uniref:GNAT family N-acetyltransferase n=1 Tax=Propioniciclava soli TaxID=2775081 RepID=A0ABZ3C5X8_9ACTN|nr:GNAT family N-acetyltransferase [Propioniciclava soli]
MELEVVDNEERERFEMRSGRKVIGWAAYQETAELIVFTHTHVDPEWEGQGIGGRLVQATLDHVRSQGMPVLSTCSFVTAWLDQHPDYADLRYRAPQSQVTD